MQLPYTQAQAEALEVSLLTWMHHIGVSGSEVISKGFAEALPALQDGTLLLAIAETIARAHVTGVKLKSVSDVTREASVRKCAPASLGLLATCILTPSDYSMYYQSTCELDLTSNLLDFSYICGLSGQYSMYYPEHILNGAALH